jgi:predicted nuclease with TOPRIM domain
MRELDLQTCVDDLDYQLTPDSIQRALAFVGSVRPMDELRDALRVRLESEKARLNKQFELLESRRGRLEAAISEADADVERLRQRLGSR